MKHRLDRFRRDLDHLAPREMVQKHILMGDCYILDHDARYTLSAKVSSQYSIRPEQIRVVGSGQLGFSVVDGKRYRPFNPDSDIDVAIVSEDLFDRIWFEVLRYDAQAADWIEEKRKFRRYLMNGWIRPDALPKGEVFPCVGSA
ncbi:MAG: hypothetical protein U0R19_15585 [Bryobacteraceae bacterium]